MKEIEWGNQKFMVDFDEEFIQMYKCYLKGMECTACDYDEECAEDLPFVYNELLKQENVH